MDRAKQIRTQTGKKAMLKALEQSLGIVTPALESAGIVRSTFYEWMKDEEFKKQVEDIHNLAIDFVENKLMDNIRKGSDTAAIFFLKCRAKSRGYIEKNEIGITDKDGNDVPITGMRVI